VTLEIDGDSGKSDSEGFGAEQEMAEGLERGSAVL